MVRRPTGPQSASLLGRCGLVQPRLAKDLADRGTVHHWYAVRRHSGLRASALARLAGGTGRPHRPTRLRLAPAGPGTNRRPLAGLRTGPGGTRPAGFGLAVAPGHHPRRCSALGLSLIHISEPTRLGMISYAV